MAKPEFEFFPVTGVPWTAVPGADVGMTERVLAKDPAANVATRILTFPPGCDTTPNGVQVHDFWEEVYILEGSFTDLELNQTFSAGDYACRPPGMPHGPWKSEAGCTTFEVRYYSTKVDRMDTLEAIRTRRTVGKSSGDLSRDLITELIEAATWAPNHKLTQPWKFAVLTGSARERLGAVWGAAAAAKADPAARAAVAEGEAKKPLRAPVVIVVSTRTDPDWVRAEEDLTATAAAVQNLLLAAHAKGLSAAWKTGKIVYSAEVKAFLGLDPSDRIIAVVYLGAVANEEPASRNRDVASTITWFDEAPLPV